MPFIAHDVTHYNELSQKIVEVQLASGEYPAGIGRFMVHIKIPVAKHSQTGDVMVKSGAFKIDAETIEEAFAKLPEVMKAGEASLRKEFERERAAALLTKPATPSELKAMKNGPNRLKLA